MGLASTSVQPRARELLLVIDDEKRYGRNRLGERTTLGGSFMSDLAENKVLMIILSIFLPPVAVFLLKGAGTDLVINIVLCIISLGLLGIIHALWLTLK